MGQRVLLTEEREDVLNGEYEGSDAALRNQKSRLRVSSRTALDELAEVVASPHIDQTEIFDPEDVEEFVRALLRPKWKYHYEEEDPSGLLHEKEKSDEFELFRSRVLLELSKLIIEEPDPRVDPED
jgi:hypothetical protein